MLLRKHLANEIQYFKMLLAMVCMIIIMIKLLLYTDIAQDKYYNKICKSIATLLAT